ncbi:hypothetical protein CSUB01_11303 [Colletotrichum sublineola]|uniref:Uncharacterized protein n=1 Tax=Colletotrichum sublineola TaxID=1173701 RepID=A0A066X2V7_COLSU|nr:hypothetical protein CSUB01_11303 [Colletotrichum sublineola]
MINPDKVLSALLDVVLQRHSDEYKAPMPTFQHIDRLKNEAPAKRPDAASNEKAKKRQQHLVKEQEEDVRKEDDQYWHRSKNFKVAEPASLLEDRTTNLDQSLINNNSNLQPQAAKKITSRSSSPYFSSQESNNPVDGAGQFTIAEMKSELVSNDLTPRARDKAKLKLKLNTML